MSTAIFASPPCSTHDRLHSTSSARITSLQHTCQLAQRVIRPHHFPAAHMSTCTARHPPPPHRPSCHPPPPPILFLGLLKAIWFGRVFVFPRRLLQRQRAQAAKRQNSEKTHFSIFILFCSFSLLEFGCIYLPVRARNEKAIRGIHKGRLR